MTITGSETHLELDNLEGYKVTLSVKPQFFHREVKDGDVVTAENVEVKLVNFFRIALKEIDTSNISFVVDEPNKRLLKASYFRRKCRIQTLIPAKKRIGLTK